MISVSETTVNGLPGVPLKFTAVAPVKPEPVMVTLTPIAPLVGENETTVGGTRTVNAPELTAVPPEVVTLINPVAKLPAGTTAVNCVSETTANVAAATTLKSTEVAPVKPDPVSVTLVPAAPLAGVKEVTCGVAPDGAMTVNGDELVPVPLAVVTLTGPELAPDGTEVFREVSDTTLNAADTPLNRTPLAPVNPDPATVTATPAGPLPGENELTRGALVAGVA